MRRIKLGFSDDSCTICGLYMYSFSPQVRQLGLYLSIAAGFSFFVMATLFWWWTTSLLHESESTAPLAALPAEEEVSVLVSAELFPIGVDPEEKHITENPVVDGYVKTYLSLNPNNSREGNFLDKFLAKLVQFDWYQNLASAVSRILVIYPGERKEEIIENIGKILKWDTTEKEYFSTLITEAEPELIEGKFYPGRYVVPLDASPELVAELVLGRFTEEIAARYSPEVAAVVPLQDALTIASLLEREAYDFTDMRYISGIMWNRMFIEMPLQLDASLQYVRGSKLTERTWWPKVVPADKYLESPYNTYENTGLPPAPIANPSVAAVVAALNPRETDCMFYFHDSKGKFYCTTTYEEHVAKLKEIYGQGK